MALPYIHKYFIVNRNLQPVKAASYLYPSNAFIIYEIIRVIDGVFLFLEDHLFRLQNSANLTKHTIPLDSKNILERLCLLIKSNHCLTGNVRLEFVYCNNHCDFLAGFVPHSYPPPDLYNRGITVVPLTAIRSNPNAKVYYRELREKIDKILADNTVYEVILVNDKGMITEGSRSNFFAVAGDSLYTPPLHQVLPGVTRKQILAIAAEADIPVFEEPLPLKHIVRYEGLFIIGTSPKILPIAVFGSYSFNPLHPLIIRLRRLYDQRIDQYIKTHKDACAESMGNIG